MGRRRDELVHRLDVPQPRRPRVPVAAQGRSRAPDRTTEGARLGERRAPGHVGRDRRRGDRPRPAVGELDLREGRAGASAATDAREPETWAAPGVTDDAATEWPVVTGAGRRGRAPHARAGRRRAAVLSSQQRSGWRALDSPRVPTPRAIRRRIGARRSVVSPWWLPPLISATLVARRMHRTGDAAGVDSDRRRHR